MNAFYLGLFEGYLAATVEALKQQSRAACIDRSCCHHACQHRLFFFMSGPNRGAYLTDAASDVLQHVAEVERAWVRMKFWQASSA